MELDSRYREPPAVHDLTDDVVDVWAVPLTTDYDRLAAVLSADERERASRFRFAEHRRRFAIAHGALRTLLSGYGGADPTTIAFTIEPRGKPRLRDRADLHFNLSHSDDLALIGIARTELGVDVERVRPDLDHREIADRYFSPLEQDVLRRLSRDRVTQGFYRGWTSKEAYLKALGCGLSQALDRFDVEIDPDRPPTLVACRDGEAATDWMLEDVTPAAGYAGAVAMRRRGARVRCWRLLPPGAPGPTA